MRGRSIARCGLWLLLALTPTWAAEPRAEELLARSGARLAEFVEEFSNVNCTELVTQAKLDKSGKVTLRQEAAFDYLLMLQIGPDSLAMDESRLPKGEAQRTKGKGKSLLMASNGFATMFLILHPYFQNSFQYEVMKEEVVDGKRVTQIAFRHLPGERTPAVLLLRGRQYPLSFAGTAWVESDSGEGATGTAG